MIIEDLRLQTISHFVDFNLEHDKELMEIVELASAVTSLPYAVISFLDEDTTYLAVRKGVTEKSIPNHLSFCIHALPTNDLMIVKDALTDERFAGNPL